MNGITSMQRSSTSYADYGKFANGKKVNRAADGGACDHPEAGDADQKL